MNTLALTPEKTLWRFARIAADRVETLIAELAVTRPTALALAALQLDPAAASRFLQPRLRDLVDPYALAGARDAAARLWRAVRDGEHILIHGDYDTDGVTATLVLATVLRENGARVDMFLPHRMDDGYGLTVESLEKAREERHSLLVTVDCGINSSDVVRQARALGLDVIITDHHEPDSHDCRREGAIVVDPKMPGSDPDLTPLAGVGVAFKVCHAFLKYAQEQGITGGETDLKTVLDLVALGTVADIVPLLGENRRLVKHGLEVLSRQQRPGIRALCEIAGVGDAVAPADIAFRLAPRLNAAGRMAAPGDSLALLAATSMVEARTLASVLDNRNRERQAIEETVISAVNERLAAEIDLADKRTLVVWGEDWHPGVIGIVASRLTRSYHRPSIVLARENDQLYSGSGRSIPRINIVAALDHCAHLLTRFGGHPMAAGLSLPRENLEAFREAFENAIRRVISPEALRPSIDVLAPVELDEITPDYFEEYRLLEPFGHGNPAPVFATAGVRPERVWRVGRGHSRGTLSSASGRRFPFIYFGTAPENLPPPPWQIAYVPELNRYNGRVSEQIRILDIHTA